MAQKRSLHPDDAPNEGAFALRILLLRRSAEWIAVRKLRGVVSRQMVLRWAYGAIPSPTNREILEADLGIPPGAWLKRAPVPPPAPATRPDEVQ